MSAQSPTYQLYCDGACRGNPGPAAIGGVIIDRDSGSTIEEISEAIGRATNNESEYMSLIRGLERLQALTGQDAGVPTPPIRIFMDSQLVVRQVEGKYKVKNARLRPLFEQVKELLAGFEDWQIAHVPREQNTEADRLANAAYRSV